MTLPANIRILLIDDNRAIHEDFRKILCPLDTSAEVDRLEAEFFGEETVVSSSPAFDIDSAYQGQEGIDIFQVARDAGRPYAVVFVDVRMPPGIDGVETAERLWRLDPDAQIVICTAYSDYSWQEMVRRLPRPDQLLVLKKPFTAIEALQMACALSAKWSLTTKARTHLEETERIVEERTRELRETAERLSAEIAMHDQTQRQLLRAQRLECIGTLAGGIAHDLNNLISPILLSVQMLKSDVTVSLREELVEIVEKCAERAAGIIKQVLTFARGIEGERIPVQIRFLVQEMERIASETFPRSIVIRTSVAKSLRLVEGDATQLQQVLMNLCVNARDAMTDGGTLTIYAENYDVDESYSSMIADARPGPYVRLRVFDTGAGIDQEHLEKIFDPFFTTKAIGKGSGLGLSSVAGIVKSHQGFIEVRSAVGKGTTFEVYLPATEGDQTAVPEQAESAAPPMGHGQMILVVDDEKDIRSVTQAALAQHGYRSLAAADGAEAIALYAGHPGEIDAVLTDLLMPVVDGVMLCRALRNIDPAGRIIVCTGEGDHEQLAELSSLRIDSVLNKPFSANVLLTAIGNALAC